VYKDEGEAETVGEDMQVQQIRHMPQGLCCNQHRPALQAMKLVPIAGTQQLMWLLLLG
jgi:hypothetical protein